MTFDTQKNNSKVQTSTIYQASPHTFISSSIFTILVHSYSFLYILHLLDWVVGNLLISIWLQPIEKCVREKLLRIEWETFSFFFYFFFPLVSFILIFSFSWMMCKGAESLPPAFVFVTKPKKIQIAISHIWQFSQSNNETGMNVVNS